MAAEATSEICSFSSNLCQSLVVNFVAHEKVYLSCIIFVFVSNKLFKWLQLTVFFSLLWISHFMFLGEECVKFAFSYIFQQQKLQPKVKSFPLSNVYCWFTSNRKNLMRTRPDPWIKKELYSLFNSSIDNNWKYTTFEMFIKKTYNSKQIVNLFSCY